MTLRYSQSSGLLTGAGITARGYSGFHAGKNNPGMQQVEATGPIPRGHWRLVRVYDSPQVGPYAIELAPQPGTETFGRSAFRIHGDSKSDPGNASHGCIILPRPIREAIWKSGDHLLEVVA